MKSILSFSFILISTFCFSQEQAKSTELKIVSMDETTRHLQSDKIVIDEINSDHLNRESLANPKNNIIYDPNDVYQKELEVINNTKNVSTVDPN